MEYFVTALIVVAIWHYVAQRVLVPDRRFVLRCELFVIRDQIREMMIHGSSQVEMAELTLLHDRCNSMINRIHHINVENVARFYKALKNSKELQRKVEARAQLIEGCSPGVKAIHIELSKLTHRAIATNSMGLIPYVAVFVLIPAVSFSLKSVVKKINVVKQHEFDRFIPASGAVDPTMVRIAA